MKRLAISIGVFGAVHATLWAWAPQIARLQMQSALERYQAIGSLETAMQVYQESMRSTYIEAGVIGGLMVLASALLLIRHRVGWALWVGCLSVALLSTLLNAFLTGLSPIAVLRLVLLGALALSSIRARNATSWAAWFRVGS